MNTLDVELSMVPGRMVDDAIRALESAGMHMVPGHDAVPMKARSGGVTYVLTVQDPGGDAQARMGVLAGVASIVNCFGNPELAPFA